MVSMVGKYQKTGQGP